MHVYVCVVGRRALRDGRARWSPRPAVCVGSSQTCSHRLRLCCDATQGTGVASAFLVMMMMMIMMIISFVSGVIGTANISKFTWSAVLASVGLP